MFIHLLFNRKKKNAAESAGCVKNKEKRGVWYLRNGKYYTAAQVCAVLGLTVCHWHLIKIQTTPSCSVSHCQQCTRELQDVFTWVCCTCWGMQNLVFSLLLRCFRRHRKLVTLFASAHFTFGFNKQNYKGNFMSILTNLPFFFVFFLIILLSPYRERAHNSFSIQKSEELSGTSHKFCYF